ncbi:MULTISPECIES: ATP-binding protein [unclassified Corallococcus]|uniref:ATP-binding protein n=1 Tax=unclassified Corallococcus TaxID=2685029 RepID=UPI001A8EFD20|nr:MULTISPECIES: ATP-binding protein [unclassified Corallococcus]MBN9685625.1 ATP-binding protein [Corallococcus sp. NCSPR001]WAS82929.1 ATP-binding protein [Corallococcus sp. NCRR]
MTSPSIPRDPLTEAHASIRGYVHQLLRAVELLTSNAPALVVAVEAFEDVVTVAGASVVATQVKDRIGTFSLTQEKACRMLERWAVEASSNNNIRFIFLSTQQPGNLHDSSSAFIRWVQGKQDSATREEIRSSLGGFLAGFKPSTFPKLTGFVTDELKFERFWSLVQWDLGAESLTQRFDRLVTHTASSRGIDSEHARNIVSGWLGEMALSASSSEFNERIWTYSRLQNSTPSLRDRQLAELLLRMDRSEEVLAAIASIRDLLQQRTFNSKASLKPPTSASSTRLDSKMKQILDSLLSGKQRVALRGRPGDGKTQVACQVAAVHPDGAYFELPRSNGRTPEEVWLQGLQQLGAELLVTDVTKLELKPLVGRVRDALVENGRGRVLVIDNADVAPSFDIRDLLRAGAGGACILVGPGVNDVDASFSLEAPSAEEFLEIATEGAQLEPKSRDLVRVIGELSDHSALIASCLKWLNQATGFVPDDLEEFEQTLRAGNFGSIDQKIEAGIHKTWACLSDLDRKRLAFIIALGQVQVPILWLPEPLRVGSPRNWAMLNDAGVAFRAGMGGERFVRIHRLIAAWVDAHGDVDVGSEVRNALLSWTRQSDLADELKSHPLRIQSFVNGYRYLLRKARTSGGPIAEDAALVETYIDCLSHVPDVEAGLRRIASDPVVDVARLPPVALGQLVDTVGPVTASKSDYLRLTRLTALTELALFVETHGVPTDVVTDEDEQQVSAAHHYAKQLLRDPNSTDEQRAKGTDLLLAIDALSTAMIQKGGRIVAWEIHRAQARLQLARGRSTLDSARRARLLLDLEDRSSAVLPIYLLVDLILLVLRLDDVPESIVSPNMRVHLLDSGLKLCQHQSNPHVQARFLREAAQAIRRHGVGSSRDVLDTLRSFIGRVRANEAVLRETSPDLAQALFKSAESLTDPSAFDAIAEAMDLFASARSYFDTYIVTRTAAVARELGLPLLAQRLLTEVVSQDEKDKYWSTLELAKAYRWAGDAATGIKTLEALLAAPNLGATRPHSSLEHARRNCALRDELAKAHLAHRAQENARRLLEDNAIKYAELGMKQMVMDCQKWLSSLDNPRAKGGALEDEWRKGERLRHLSPERLRATEERANAVVARLLSLPRR